MWSDWIKDGMILKYESPEYRHYPAAHKIDGYIAAVRGTTITLATNTQRIGKADQPRFYEDLLKPKFSGGVIGIPDARRSSQGREWYVVTRHYLGRDFMVKLAKQKPLVVRGGGDLIARLVSAEVGVAVQTSDRAIAAKRKGAPIEVMWPGDGVILSSGLRCNHSKGTTSRDCNAVHGFCDGPERTCYLCARGISRATPELSRRARPP